MIPKDIIRESMERTLYVTRFEGLGQRYQGKVRDCYTEGSRRIIVSTDRISAFDRVLGTIPFKGQVLNQLASFWFEKTKDLVPNHVIETPDPQVVVAHECHPLKVEIIVRAYLTGVTTTSIWYNYERGVRSFCGHTLPEGLKKNQRLPAAIITPTTKAEQGQHDKNGSREELIADGWVTAEDFDEAAGMAMKLFSFGQEWAKSRGLILVDTKYELGRTPDGRMVFIDEIHTPDSSRYWYADDYEALFAEGKDPRSLDKEFVRRWFVDHGYRGEGEPPIMDDGVRVEAARRYIQTLELLTGKSFVPDYHNPEARLRKNLEKYGLSPETPGLSDATVAKEGT